MAQKNANANANGRFGNYEEYVKIPQHDRDTGSITAPIAKAYARMIAGMVASNEDWKDIAVYGLPEKGAALAASVTVALWKDFGIDAGWFFKRNVEKTYGEATNLLTKKDGAAPSLSKEDLAKSMIVGRIPTSDTKIILLDEFMTMAAGTKYAAVKDLKELLDNPQIVALSVAAEKHETFEDGEGAAEKFTEHTGIPVYSSLNAGMRHLGTNAVHERSVQEEIDSSAGLEAHKVNLIEALIKSKALKTDGDFTLKSGRPSPYFLNMGDVNSGSATAMLAEAYASMIADMAASQEDFADIAVYGIPEKGVALSAAVAVTLWENFGIDAGWFFTRKGETTILDASVNLSKKDLATSMITGKVPASETKIILLDDVLTTADTKHAAIKSLNALLDNPQIAALAIAADRQEVGINGKSALDEFTKATDIPVSAALNATEIRRYLGAKEGYDQHGVGRIATYLRVYGTDEAISAVKADGLEKAGRIVLEDRSVIPACDVTSIQDFENLVKATADIEGIGGYKVGFSLALTYGLPKIVKVARKYTAKPIIYDHQKAGTDVPDTAGTFMHTVKSSGVDSVILFPQSGPETERAWIYRALDNDLTFIVGGIMTHAAYLVSEGGFMQDSAAFEIYRIAAKAGGRNFVVPGTKPEIISKVQELVRGEGVKDPAYFVPGMVTQGATFKDVSKALGKYWNAIVGRAITTAKDGDYKTAAEDQVKQLIG
jgi:orotidine-5'-phosphate decarboxylase